MTNQVWTPGDRIADYRLVAQIWASAEAEVWRALPEKSPFASDARILKIGKTAAGRVRIEREADALSRLVGKPSNQRGEIVPMCDVALGNEPPYLAQPDFPGTSLAAQIDKRGPIDEPTAANLLGDLLAVMAFAHERGVIHGHITPGAILVDSGLNAAVVDFGHFSTVDADVRVESAGTETETETARGNTPSVAAVAADGLILPFAGDASMFLELPMFRAPELDRELLGPRTDLFGVGMAVAFALLGERMRRFVDEPLDRLGVSTTLLRILSRLTDENPAARYASAAAAAEVVRAVYFTRSLTRSFGRLPGGASRIGSDDDDDDASDISAAARHARAKKLGAATRTKYFILALFLPLGLLAMIFVLDIFSEIPDDDTDTDDAINAPVTPRIPGLFGPQTRPHFTPPTPPQRPSTQPSAPRRNGAPTPTENE